MCLIFQESNLESTKWKNDSKNQPWKMLVGKADWFKMQISKIDVWICYNVRIRSENLDGYISLSFYLSICLSIYLSIYLSVYLLYIYICLSGTNTGKSSVGKRHLLSGAKIQILAGEFKPKRFPRPKTEKVAWKKWNRQLFFGGNVTVKNRFWKFWGRIDLPRLIFQKTGMETCFCESYLENTGRKNGFKSYLLNTWGGNSPQESRLQKIKDGVQMRNWFWKMRGETCYIAPRMQRWKKGRCV